MNQLPEFSAIQRKDIYLSAIKDIDKYLFGYFLCTLLNSVLFDRCPSLHRLTQSELMNLFPEFKLFSPDESIYSYVWWRDLNHSEGIPVRETALLLMIELCNDEIKRREI
jgi:hypothetical protein